MLNRPRKIERPLKPLADLLAEEQAAEWAEVRERIAAEKERPELPAYFHPAPAKLTWWEQWKAFCKDL